MLRFILNGHLKVRLHLSCSRIISADTFHIAGDDPTKCLGSATKLARRQARGKCQCSYNMGQNMFIQGGAKSLIHTALFCPYDVTDGAIWSTNLPKAFKK